jgi:hypothetical protein
MSRLLYPSTRAVKDNKSRTGCPLVHRSDVVWLVTHARDLLSSDIPILLCRFWIFRHIFLRFLLFRRDGPFQLLSEDISHGRSRLADVAGPDFGYQNRRQHQPRSASRLVKSRLEAVASVDDVAANHSHQHLHSRNVFFRHGQNVLRQHHYVGKFTGLNRAFRFFLERKISVVLRFHA